MSFARELARLWSDFRLSADLSDFLEVFEVKDVKLGALAAERTDGDAAAGARRMPFGAWRTSRDVQLWRQDWL